MSLRVEIWTFMFLLFLGPVTALVIFKGDYQRRGGVTSGREDEEIMRGDEKLMSRHVNKWAR